jgi:undecaprenyl-diphosphatase
MLELIGDIAALGLILAALHIGLGIYVRRRWPAWATPLKKHRLGVFEGVTSTASARILFPLTAGAALALLLVKRRSEALILAASVISAATIVYVVKTAAGRVRPALWETEWYWGSSFPSGHTLVVTAFATAAALCVSRIALTSYKFVLPIAILWTLLVGLSRMVLGVHWPTDVLAAWCIGALLPLAARVALGLSVDGPARAA